MKGLRMKLLFLVAAFCGPAAAFAEPDPSDWNAVLEEADGQTVYWHAWGGSTPTNAFIEWIGDKVAQDAGVTLEHVKLTDTADAVTRVLAERQAGETQDGAVDLIWINGANFAAMKQGGLLFGPWSNRIPNNALVVEDDVVTNDFGTAVDGLESPWAKAQLVFMYDSDDAPPLSSMGEIKNWAAENPGRFTFPQPPDFLGTTFLKQALVSLVEDPAVLQDPVEQHDFDAVTAPLWAYLDEITPTLWRSGKAYPATGPAQFQLLSDDEIDMAPSLSPSEASTAIANFQLPESVRTFVPETGTIGNASFVAIPFNSGSKAGAMVVANALLSPEAQLRAQDPEVLGYGTVLDMDKLSRKDAAAFADLKLGIATLPPADLGRALPEPHASWSAAVESAWLSRYGAE